MGCIPGIPKAMGMPKGMGGIGAGMSCCWVSWNFEEL
jgi:hypothetical protein